MIEEQQGLSIRSFHKTRIAPTPSGYLHLGNVLSFIITAGLARKFNAGILLRIDDLDQERIRTDYIRDIFDSLLFLNIPWDEGPRNVEDHLKHHSQLHRAELYKEVLYFLKKNDRVFACDCSRSQLPGSHNNKSYPGTCMAKHLPLEEKGYNWRIYTNAGNDIQVNDLFKGNQKFGLPATMQDFVVRKKDNDPAYQLASVVDDLHYGVDLVIRGEDLLDSTLAQLYLAGVLPPNGFLNAVFYHHPLIKQCDGKKLSKSAGDTSVQLLRKTGKSPAEIFTMIAQALGYCQPVARWEELFEWYISSRITGTF
ncbi:MAG: hypothetical protein KF862_02735 [Chitinophagaceae bacterium]|nr:hypothetical protein [Chitinophagaceae bacterium]